MDFLLSVVALSAVIVAFMLVERIFRSPNKPQWLDREMVVMPICVAFTGAIATSVGAVLATSLDLPMPLWGDALTALGAIVAVILVVRWAFRLVGGSRKAPAA